MNGLWIRERLSTVIVNSCSKYVDKREVCKMDKATCFVGWKKGMGWVPEIMTRNGMGLNRSTHFSHKVFHFTFELTVDTHAVVDSTVCMEHGCMGLAK